MSVSNSRSGYGIFSLILSTYSCTTFANSFFTIFVMLVRNIVVIALAAILTTGSPVLH